METPNQQTAVVNTSKLASLSTFTIPTGLELHRNESGASQIRHKPKKQFLADEKARITLGGKSPELWDKDARKNAQALFKAVVNRNRATLKAAVIVAISEDRMLPEGLTANKKGAFTAIKLVKPAAARLAATEQARDNYLSSLPAEVRALVEQAEKAGKAMVKAQDKGTIDVQATETKADEAAAPVTGPEVVATSA